jgi:hypothetical protein
MAFDTRRGRTVCCGGLDANLEYVPGTVEWNGQVWAQAVPVSPDPRAAHAMAYDPPRDRVVLFGGGAAAHLDDTWEWDGSRWSRRTPATVPPARAGHAMAFDQTRSLVVMFGGADSMGTAFNDTWEWNGVDWTWRYSATSPPIRLDHAMAYDANRRRLVLFGGNARGQAIGDTWEWDGNVWTRMQPTAAPARRAGHAMSYDPIRGRTVLFGGLGSGGFLGDTWEWDGTNWTQVPTITAPVGRRWPGMVFDSRRQRCVLHGGFDGTLLGDSWEFDGVRWMRRSSSVELGRRGAAMVFDEARDRVLLFGGWGTFGAQTPLGGWLLGDTWARASTLLSANLSMLPIATGGRQEFEVVAGTGNANRLYLMVGSITGTAPGVRLFGIPIPLNPDAYTDIILSIGNSREFVNVKGQLDARGVATAALQVPPGLPVPGGFTLHHACLVHDASGRIHAASNAVPLRLQ